MCADMHTKHIFLFGGDMGFHKNNDLIKHLCLHTGEKPFECKICDEIFASKINFTVHSCHPQQEHSEEEDEKYNKID